MPTPEKYRDFAERRRNDVDMARRFGNTARSLTKFNGSHAHHANDPRERELYTQIADAQDAIREWYAVIADANTELAEFYDRKAESA